MISTGGVYIRPHLLKGRYEHHFREKDRVVDVYLAPVRKAMHEVATDERGTAYSSFRMLEGLGVDSAGKTGSAEVGGARKTHSWYCGFCPYSDPVLAYSWIIEHGGHGSEAAVPVMASILRNVYQNEELRQDLGIKPYFNRKPTAENEDAAPVQTDTDNTDEQDDAEPVEIIIE
jgi:cell division protein FtsI/penicillin-binding protein 2